MSTIHYSSGAIMSQCDRYRFQLWRIWDYDMPRVFFLMHNPSKADANESDPTIRRCINFAQSWGFGGMYVGNLTPYRATDPNSLSGLDFQTVYPRENIKHIQQMLPLCQLNVMAFGETRSMDAAREIYELAQPDEWFYLRLTKSGKPGHPLYLPKNLKSVPFPGITL